MIKQYIEDRPWRLFPNWMKTIQTKYWRKKIDDNVIWEQPYVRVYGSSYLVPRKTIFLAENKITYRYSGTYHYGKGWPEWFCPLLENVCSASSAQFNGCLINLYRTGNDRMGWHSDNELELDPYKPIASLSFGSSRDFVLKHKDRVSKEVLNLSDGDLLIMKPDCQKYWLHSVPRRRKINSARINLTFRCYKK